MTAGIDDLPINAVPVYYDDDEAIQLHTLNVDITPEAIELGADVLNALPGQVYIRSATIAGVTAGEPVVFNATGSALLSTDNENYSDSLVGYLDQTLYVKLVAGADGSTVFGGVESNGIADSFAVTANTGTPPSITTQPTSQVVFDGDEFSFTLAGSNISSIQWYEVGVGAIAGATGLTYSGTAALADTDTQYYAVVTSGSGITVQSNTVELTVMANISATGTPKERTIFMLRDGSVMYSPLYKDPLANMDYAVDLSSWLKDDTIVSATFTEEGGLEITGQGFSTTGGRVFVNGGGNAERCEVIFRATTTEGRTVVVRFFVITVAFVF